MNLACKFTRHIQPDSSPISANKKRVFTSFKVRKREKEEEEKERKRREGERRKEEGRKHVDLERHEGLAAEVRRAAWTSLARCPCLC